MHNEIQQLFFEPQILHKDGYVDLILKQIIRIDF